MTERHELVMGQCRSFVLHWQARLFHEAKKGGEGMPMGTLEGGGGGGGEGKWGGGSVV